MTETGRGKTKSTKFNTYGLKHTDETKRKISKIHKGKIAWNKGIPNPEQSKRMKENNPNKLGLFGNKFEKGRVATNKKEDFTIICEYCKTEKQFVSRRRKDNPRFCNKSCAQKYVWEIKKCLN